jgi:hypothetical protein
MKQESAKIFSILEQSFLNMTFNSRNAEFEARNAEQDEFSSSHQFSDEQITNQASADQFTNQASADQFTNQSARSTETTFDVMFIHAQRMKIADIVTAALRMNRQNNSLSDMSSLTSMIIFFETRSDR